VSEDRWTVEDLIQRSFALSSERMTGVKTGLRRWLSAVAVDPENAKQRMERLKSNMRKDKDITAYLENVYDKWKDEQRFPIYDILTINTINTQKTKQL
jgi:hypothetical protein